MSGDTKQTGAADAPPEAAAPRKPWLRPYYELATVDETENGPLGGPDASSSVS